ncbi:protein of unknown function (plasmid) [Streptantibioticus cattleyicolor NRRL 8057 = DSM 46488]|nr:protein of unknown function [Streptantibioticus cattleyicolor NRRL 8057 = DSM 46488]
MPARGGAQYRASREVGHFILARGERRERECHHRSPPAAPRLRHAYRRGTRSASPPGVTYGGQHGEARPRRDNGARRRGRAYGDGVPAGAIVPAAPSWRTESTVPTDRKPVHPAGAPASWTRGLTWPTAEDEPTAPVPCCVPPSR